MLHEEKVRRRLLPLREWLLRIRPGCVERGKGLAARVLAKKTLTERYITTLQLVPFGEGVVKELKQWVEHWQNLGCVSDLMPRHAVCC